MERPKMRIEDIIIKERVRKDYGDIENLALSIRTFGLLHPIVINAKKELVAGERRLKAHRELGLEEIEYLELNELSTLDCKEIELEENLKRKDFTWHEEISAKKALDDIKRKKYKSTVKGHGGGWGLKETAQALEESIGTVSQDIKLAKAIEEFPELAKEKNKSTAWKKYQSMKESAVKQELASRVQIKIEDTCLVKGKAEVVMKELKSESVHLIVTDPPWGIDIQKSAEGKDWDEKGHEGFEDSKYQALDTLSLVLKECYRVLVADSHAYVFFGIQMYKEVKTLLEDVGFYVEPVPLMWFKKSGGQPGTDFHFPIAYETIFFCLKGKRALNSKGKHDVFEVERVPPAQKIHPTEKPRRLLRQFIELSSDPGQLVVDPYGGSCATLLAAFEVDRQAWGSEVDDTHYNSGLLAIKGFRDRREK